ncbi:MAG: PKD domain-containing protein [Caldiserica bacterium]|nr:PKD domain-containing protein [Caldisericota bacterium]
MSTVCLGKRTMFLRGAAILVLASLAVVVLTSCKRKTLGNQTQTTSVPFGTAVTWGPLKISKGYVEDLTVDGSTGVGSVSHDIGTSTEGTYVYALNTQNGTLIGDAKISGRIYETDIGERYVFVWVKDGISVYDLKKQFAFVQTIPTGAPQWVMNIGDFLYVEVRNASDYVIDKRTLKKRDLHISDDDFIYKLLYPDCIIEDESLDSTKPVGDPAIYNLETGKVLGHVPSKYLGGGIFAWDPQKNLFFSTDRDKLVVYDFSQNRVVSEIVLTRSEVYDIVAASNGPGQKTNGGDRLQVIGNTSSLTDTSYFFNGGKYAYVVDTSGQVVAEEAGSEILGSFGGYAFSRKGDSIFRSDTAGNALWTKKRPEEPFFGRGPYFTNDAIVWLCESGGLRDHGDGIYQWSYDTGSFLNYTEFTGYEAQVLSSQPLIVAMRSEKGGVDAGWYLVCYEPSKLPFNWIPDFSIDCSPDKVYSAATDATFTCTVKNVPAEFGSNDISYAWDFGDGTTGTGNGIVHRFAKDGSYNVTVFVKYGNSLDALSKSQQIAVLKSPDIRLVATPEYYVADGLTYRLEFKTDNPSEFGNVTWDFGDGKKGSTTNVLHTYKLGNYTAKATVTNGDKTQSWQGEVAISARYPEFSTNASPLEGTSALEVNFACSRVDTDLPEAGLTYAWKMGSDILSDKSSFGWVFINPGAYRVTLEVTDPASKSLTNKTFTMNVYQPNLTFSDGGRKIQSNSSMFVDKKYDVDEDGINQAWEEEAMIQANPYFELDNMEEWLNHRDTDKVVNFVRITPYTTKSNERYVLFIYAITWSRDYGRYGSELPFAGAIWGIKSHNGDVEKVIMAWKVIDDRNLELKYVYTSAHGSESTSHSAVWNATGSTENKGKTLHYESGKTDDDVMRATLEFQNNALKLQASGGKHAIYPTAACGNSVLLVWPAFGEDCGGGGVYQFACYNAGEPSVHLIDDIGNIFPNERVWSGNTKNPSRFCGGLECNDDGGPGPIGSSLKTINDTLTKVLEAIPAQHNP